MDKLEEKIIDALGHEQALQEISKALDYATKEDIYDYIIRMWDIDYIEE